MGGAGLGILSSAIIVPSSADFAWKASSQGSASIVDTSFGFTIVGDVQTGTHMRLFGRAIPVGATWRATVGLRLTAPMITGGDTNCGLYLRDSSGGKITALILQQTQGTFNASTNLFWGKYTNRTTFSALYQQQGYASYVLWIRVDADATNYTFSASQDGTNFSTYYQPVSKTDFLASAADEVGIFLDPAGNAGPSAYLSVFHYQQG